MFGALKKALFQLFKHYRELRRGFFNLTGFVPAPPPLRRTRRVDQSCVCTTCDIDVTGNHVGVCDDCLDLEETCPCTRRLVRRRAQE